LHSTRPNMNWFSCAMGQGRACAHSVTEFCIRNDAGFGFGLWSEFAFADTLIGGDGVQGGTLAQGRETKPLFNLQEGFLVVLVEIGVVGENKIVHLFGNVMEQAGVLHAPHFEKVLVGPLFMNVQISRDQFTLGVFWKNGFFPIVLLVF